MDIWVYPVVAALSYALGSIPSGVIAARLFANANVHSIGSGHTGAINTYRAAGLPAAALTLIADGAKGLLAASLARFWLGESGAVALAATLVVIGHCYPLFTRLRGGMGLATAGGVFLLLQPFALIALFIIWFPLRWLLRESTYASIGVALLLPIVLFFLGADEITVAAGSGVGAVLTWRHLQVVMQKRSMIKALS